MFGANDQPQARGGGVVLQVPSPTRRGLRRVAVDDESRWGARVVATVLAHLGSAGDQRRRTIKLKTRRRLPRTLSEESVKLIIDACDRLRDRFLIELLAGTGMRIGEALGLRHEDIDAASTLIRIRARRNVNGARVKGGQRDIPVSPSLIRLYTDYLVEDYGDLDFDYVFVNLWGGTVGTPWRYWNVTDLRLVEVNQRTVDNLTKIIGSLENDTATAEPGENDAC